jgi:hypothetical protein
MLVPQELIRISMEHLWVHLRSVPRAETDRRVVHQVQVSVRPSSLAGMAETAMTLRSTEEAVAERLALTGLVLSARLVLLAAAAQVVKEEMAQAAQVARLTMLVLTEPSLIQLTVLVEEEAAVKAALGEVRVAGNWDASNTANWSLTSGGPTGASVPASTNDVIFDANSGSGTVAVTATATCKSVTFFGFTQTFSPGSQTINLAGTGTVWNPMTTAFTFTAGTSTLKLTDTSSSAKTFDGGGLTYHNLYITGAGTGTYSILGANTFNDFKADTPPHTIMFEGGKRQTVTTFTVNGTAGNLMTLHSTVSGTQWELACSSQLVCDYLSLKDSRGVQLT